jgi:purine-binding chemotaxis protein CheW
MSDPRSPFTASSAGDREPPQRGGASSEILQRALQSLQGGAGGMLSPDQVAEIAQRVGMTQPGQLADLSRLFAGSVAEGVPVPAVPQQLVFSLADTECSLPAEAVQAVERLTEVTPVPNTMPWVLGVVQVRGTIYSVVDLRGFFDLPPAPITVRTRLLVVTVRDMAVGLVVDGVTEMRPLDDAVTQGYAAATPDWAAPYAERTTIIDGRSVVMLDPERLLFADKLHRYRADFG